MVKKILLILVVIVVLFLIFRNVDIVKNTITQETSTSEPVFTVSPNDFQQKTINGDLSVITWFGENKIQAKSHTGSLRFDDSVSFVGLAPVDAEGTLAVVGGQFVVDMTTLSAIDEPEILVNHLRSADFFDVEIYPQANLTVIASNKSEIKGFLTVRSKTQEVTIPYTLEKTGDVYIISGKVELDRTLWDVTTLSGSFFDDIGDSIIEDIIRVNFTITTNE